MIFSSGCEMEGQSETNATGIQAEKVSYLIDGRPVTLVNGMSVTQAAPGSASKIVTKIDGRPTMADINQDGLEDKLQIMTHSSGGSGTYYYFVAALAASDGYEGTEGILLGDRIAPAEIKVNGRQITIGWLDRGPGQPFSATPDQPRQRVFIYDAETRQFAQVERDFEGEADPRRMTLSMKPWIWVKAIYNNDTVVQPKQADAFSLTFGEDGHVNITTDCNTLNTRAIVESKQLRFDERMIDTRMYCEGAQEEQFSKMLTQVRSYFFTSKGELILEFAYDSGSMIFR
jgi:heat shock protein HslJ